MSGPRTLVPSHRRQVMILRTISQVTNPWCVSAALLATCGLFSSPALAADAANRTEICHLDADSNEAAGWSLLEVAGRALAKHLAHGDGLPGEEVPQTNSQAIFGAECTVVIVDLDGDGILDDDDNCPTVPNADQLDRYGSPKGDACEDDYNDNGLVDVEEPEICISVDGVTVLWNGSLSGAGQPVCTTTPTTGDTSNVAISTGFEVYVTASLGNGNIAIAEADEGSLFSSPIATASGGHFNYAYAFGAGSVATAGPGNYNTAIAIWDGVPLAKCTAEAAEPDGVTVIVTDCDIL